MFESLKPLLDSGILNEETRQSLEEAFKAKISEAREQIRAEIREEMANRYKHDREVMVEALDRMVTESLTSEIKKIAAERDTITEDRVRFTNAMMQKANNFDSYLSENLVREISELRSDRVAYQNKIKKLESFVAENLQAEIREFAQDKAELAATRVAVVAEGRQRLEAIQKSFIKKSSSLVESIVTNHLRSELSQLKTDIQEAKENNFGRKIFEAFSTEFGASYLNERADLKKLQNQLGRMAAQISEAKETAVIAQAEVKAKDQEIRRINESVARESKINDLLKSLSKEKAAVMSTLLESVPTGNLDAAFKKYLKPVMENGIVETPKKVLTESHSEVTGDRAVKSDPSSNNIIEMKRLAGLVRN
jgi:hypothetical protein